MILISRFVGRAIAENKIFEKSRMAAKMADMLWNGCRHGN